MPTESLESLSSPTSSVRDENDKPVKMRSTPSPTTDAGAVNLSPANRFKDSLWTTWIDSAKNGVNVKDVLGLKAAPDRLVTLSPLLLFQPATVTRALLEAIVDLKVVNAWPS